MASIKTLKSGNYRAQIFVSGIRESKVFPTKREASSWAASRETELRLLEKTSPGDQFTLSDAIERYQREVSPTKRGGKNEIVRLKALFTHLPVDLPINQITPEVINSYKEKRLSVVKPGAVLRELSLLSGLFTTAQKEWRWGTGPANLCK